MLVRGREAGQQFAWREAYTSLSLADESSSLEGADLELLAAAAYLLGHVDHRRQALQRAHRAYIAAGDMRRAARCLFWVAFTRLLEGNLAVAGGWLAKAGRILDQEPPDCPELKHAASAVVHSSARRKSDTSRQASIIEQ